MIGLFGIVTDTYLSLLMIAILWNSYFYLYCFNCCDACLCLMLAVRCVVGIQVVGIWLYLITLICFCDRLQCWLGYNRTNRGDTWKMWYKSEAEKFDSGRVEYFGREITSSKTNERGTWAAVCDRHDWFADVIRTVYAYVYFSSFFLLFKSPRPHLNSDTQRMLLTGVD